MTRLDRILRPKTVAVIGGRPAERVAQQCDLMGFAGEIWPVHPTRDRIAGRPCYPSLDDLPGAPDVAYVGVNRRLTVEMIRRLAEMGAGGAIAYASGFSEAEAETGDGHALQAALLEAAGAMPVLGPNCYGMINTLDGAPLWPDQHGLAPVERGVAIASQSSNIALNLTMQRRGLPVAYILTAGNQAQTGLSELGLTALEDPRVTALGMHIEAIDDLAAFEHLARRARALGKPIVAVKSGRTAESQAAAMSHTASLSGGDRAADALFARLGIARVDTLSELLETLKLLHAHGPLPGAAICSMSCSGGEAGLMADAAVGRRATFPALTDTDRARVKATLNEIVAVANPLDYHTFIWADAPAMTRCFTAMMARGFDLSLLVLDFPRADRCDDADWNTAVDAIVAASRETAGKAAVLASLPELLPESWASRLLEAGVAPMTGIAETMAAIDAAAFIGEAWSKPAPAPLLSPAATAGASRILDEAAAKAALAAFGLPIPTGEVAESPSKAAAAADRIGYPVAVKALGIAHKTEAGGVALNLASAEAVYAAADAMLDIERADERFLVEHMGQKPSAELILGAHRDPVVGLLLTIGAGGVLAELMDDAATLTLPTDAETVRAAIEGLRVHKLLAGWRGGPAADIEAAVAAALAVAAYVESEAARLDELDVNPLLLYPRGALAVDALIRIRGDAP